MSAAQLVELLPALAAVRALAERLGRVPVPAEYADRVREDPALPPLKHLYDRFGNWGEVLTAADAGVGFPDPRSWDLACTLALYDSVAEGSDIRFPYAISAADLVALMRGVEERLAAGATLAAAYRDAVLACEQPTLLHLALSREGDSVSDILERTTALFPHRLWKVFCRRVAVFEAAGGELTPAIAETIHQLEALREREQTSGHSSTESRPDAEALARLPLSAGPWLGEHSEYPTRG